MAEFGGGGVLGGLGAIVSGIASAVRAFAGITAEQLLNFLRYLREHLLELSRALYKGLKETAKALARSVRAIARGLRDGVRQLVLWTARKIKALHTFLEQKLAPVFRFLEKLRKRIDAFYKKYVRPVLDVIDFIRALNQVLEVFHIDLLQSLDAVLGEIERRIQQPFLWVQQQITRIDGWLDRIIGLDGLYQKFTLVASLRRYGPTWMQHFWDDQITPPDPATLATQRGREYPPHDSAKDRVVLTEYFRTGGGEAAATIDELGIILMQVARGTQPAPATGTER